MSDRKRWWIGAALLLVTVLLGNVVLNTIGDEHYVLARVALLAIPLLVAFLVAFKSTTAGLQRALLYIPLFAGILLALSFAAWLAGIDNEFTGVTGLYGLLIVLATVFAPPVVLGALGGWLLRRMRG